MCRVSIYHDDCVVGVLSRRHWSPADDTLLSSDHPYLLRIISTQENWMVYCYLLVLPGFTQKSDLTWLDLTWVMLSAAVVYKSILAPEQTIRWKLIICLCVIIVLSFKCFCLKILLICNVYCCWKGVLLKSFKLWRSSNSKFHDVTAALWQKVLSTCYN